MTLLVKYKKALLVVAPLAVVVLVIILASSRPQERQRRPGGSNPRSGEMRMPVRGVVITPRELDNKILATGNVLATEEVELRAEVSGKVTQIPFTEGSHVQKGDLLVKINDSELRAQLEKAESRKKLLEDKEARQRKLLEMNGVSQEQYDESLNELNSIKAEVSLLNAQLDKTEIRAPFGGVVGLRYVSEGSYISPTTLVASLQDISSVKIEFSIPEKYSGLVQKGNKIRFTLEGSSRQHEGSIYAIEPKIDPVTRTLKMRAIARNEREIILPGSFAKIELLLKKEANAVLVPTYAIIPDLQGQRVYVARNGKATLVNVETGIRTEEKIQVIKGLQVNDTLITTGLLQLRPGVPVAITIEQ